MSRVPCRRPALLLAAVPVALAVLLLATPAPPDVAHAQPMPPQPPAGNDAATGLSSPSDIDYRQGRAVIADTGNHRIAVFNVDGTFDNVNITLAFMIGGPGSGNGTGEFSSPKSVAMTRNHRIAVADTGNHRIQVFHPNGTFDFMIGGPNRGNGTGEFSSPMGVGMLSRSELYVADTGNHRIQVFRPNGVFDFMIGGPTYFGNDTVIEEFSSPEDVEVEFPSGDIAVADTGNHRIQRLDPDGSFWIEFGTEGNGTRQLSAPGSIEIAGSTLVVADTGNHRVQLFTSLGTHADVIGTKGTGDGQLLSPEGAVIGGWSMPYVADTGNHRIQVFYRNGTLHPNSTSFFNLPLPGGNGNGTDGPPATGMPGGNGTDGPPATGMPGGNGTDGPPATGMPGGNGTDGPPATGMPGGNGTDGPPATGMPGGNGTSSPSTHPADLSHIAPDSNGMLPPDQSGISREAAAVMFAPRTNFTRAGTGEAHTGQINVTVASGERQEAAVAALVGLGNAGASERIGTVVEIGSPDEDIALDGIAIVLLRGQPPHAELYHMDSAGSVTKIPECGSAEYPADWLGDNLASTPFCHVASGGSAAMWNYTIYTYRLSAFFAVGSQPPPAGAVDSCSIALADESLAVSAAPGSASQPVKQTLSNAGSLVLKNVEINATRWFFDPAGEPPYGANAASLPPTLTELSLTYPALGTFKALPAGGTAPLPLAAGLPPDGELSLWYRLNLDGRQAGGGVLVQYVSYVAECAAPAP